MGGFRWVASGNGGVVIEVELEIGADVYIAMICWYLHESGWRWRGGSWGAVKARL